MFKVPDMESINVMGVPIRIEISDTKCDQLGADGYYSVGQNAIVLRSEYGSYHRFLVVLSHEILHSHFDTLGTQLDHTLEEVLATTISENLAGLFLALDEMINNPPEVPEDTQEEE